MPATTVPPFADARAGDAMHPGIVTVGVLSTLDVARVAAAT